MINPFPGSPADVLVDLGERVLRVQVKSTPAARWYSNGSGRKYKRYEFRIVSSYETVDRYAGKRIDLFAFVALDKKQALYLPAKDIVSKAGSKVFTEESFLFAATNSLDRCLAAL